MHLTPEDSAQLPEYYAGPEKGGVAGIFIRWDKTTDTGHGLLLAYNRIKATEVSDIEVLWNIIHSRKRLNGL